MSSNAANRRDETKKYRFVRVLSSIHRWYHAKTTDGQEATPQENYLSLVHLTKNKDSLLESAAARLAVEVENLAKTLLHFQGLLGHPYYPMDTVNIKFIIHNITIIKS
ncbi:Protein of unknown function [Gryllus bimaculatus]|nr:Protein of unknown function [Gryllus bimaculatus]